MFELTKDDLIGMSEEGLKSEIKYLGFIIHNIGIKSTKKEKDNAWQLLATARKELAKHN